MTLKERDNRSYVEAVKEVDLGRLQFWMVRLEVNKDVLLIKSILKDIQVTVECVLLLRDNKVLLTFNSQANQNAF